MRRKKAQLHPGTGCTGRRIANGAVAQTVERLHGMQEVARSTRASSTGMTAEVADTLRKRRRSGFDSRHLHRAVLAALLGIEEDGNLPDSDSGETRFDSAGPDNGFLAETDLAASRIPA